MYKDRRTSEQVSGPCIQALENLLVPLRSRFMELGKRVKIGLDETRMLVLGAQITPTVATPRIPADLDPTRDQPITGGKYVDPFLGGFSLHYK
jgi:hypothetical protein